MTKELDDKEIERLLTWIKSLKGGPILDDPEMEQSEARAMAQLEYLENRIPMEPPDLNEAKEASPATNESDLFKLEWYAEKLVERIKAGDEAAARDFAEAFIAPLRNQITRDANPPPGRNLAKDRDGNPVTAELVANKVNDYLAIGIVPSSIAITMAADLGISEPTIYRRLHQAIQSGLCPQIFQNSQHQEK